jgi:hypothetical protein
MFLGMTTWNLGEIVTVSMDFLSIDKRYDNCRIDRSSGQVQGAAGRGSISGSDHI